MADVFDVARAFLSIEAMTNKKLQKLCFYAKALYLAIYDENLINDEFEAWVHGAVNPELYHAYKEWGFDKIPKYTGDTSDINEEIMSFAEEVFKAYGHLTGNDLEALNHTEDPWLNAREGLRPWEPSNNVISEEEMKVYYRKYIKESN